MLRLVLTLLALVSAGALLVLVRLLQILSPRRAKPARQPGSPAHLLIVLGSGGHTAEMIAMLDRAYAPSADMSAPSSWENFTCRTWVVSSGDAISAQRAKVFEEKMAALGKGGREKRVRETVVLSYEIYTVPRAREIHQSVYTAPVSSIRCAIACVQVLLRGELPDVILCNGPATATIVVFTSVVLRFFDVRGSQSRGKMRTVYVESWARVKKLSLSGLLLSRVVDRFLVQWPQLEKAGQRAEYIGVLV